MEAKSSKEIDKTEQGVVKDSVNMDVVKSLEITLSAVIGTKSMQVRNIAKLKAGAVIQLDKASHDSVIDLYANNILIARGELVASDNGLGVKIKEILSTDIDT